MNALSRFALYGGAAVALPWLAVLAAGTHVDCQGATAKS